MIKGRARVPVDAQQALAILRDRRGVGDVPLPLGDRRALDALIATHGVIFDTRERVLWVSEPPHLLGRFVAFDLGRMLGEGYRAEGGELAALGADAL